MLPIWKRRQHHWISIAPQHSVESRTQFLQKTMEHGKKRRVTTFKPFRVRLAREAAGLWDTRLPVHAAQAAPAQLPPLRPGPQPCSLGEPPLPPSTLLLRHISFETSIFGLKLFAPFMSACRAVMNL